YIPNNNAIVPLLTPGTSSTIPIKKPFGKFLHLNIYSIPFHQIYFLYFTIFYKLSIIIYIPSNKRTIRKMNTTVLESRLLFSLTHNFAQKYAAEISITA